MDHHIDRYFDEALEGLKRQILLMGTKVESMVADCMTALKTKDVELTERIIDSDHAVNALEVAIDELCIGMLARYQPAANDLRFITRGLKIVTDLERIGDLAVNIASRIQEILRNGACPLDLGRMVAVVQNMLKFSLDAFVNLDVAKAEEVLKNDDVVDDLTEKFVTELIEKSKTDAELLPTFFPTASIVRYLERIADHSTNIAELAIFTAKGRDVRHNMPH
jgi:phosphate transport system protein